MLTYLLIGLALTSVFVAYSMIKAKRFSWIDVALGLICVPFWPILACFFAGYVRYTITQGRAKKNEGLLPK